MYISGDTGVLHGYVEFRVQSSLKLGYLLLPGYNSDR